MNELNENLLLSAKNIDFDRFMREVDNGADIHASGENGDNVLTTLTQSMLTYAEYEKGEPILEFLIQHGFDVNRKDKRKIAAIHYLAQSGSYDALNSIIEAGANINAKDGNGNTPLILSISRNRPRNTTLLLDHGADVNIVNRLKKNALMTIAPKKQITNLLRILALTKNVDAQDRDCNTALMGAAYDKIAANIEALLNAGADMNRKNNKGDSAYEMAKRKTDKHILALFESHILDKSIVGDQDTTDALRF